MKKVFALAGVLVLTAVLALPVFGGPKKDAAGKQVLVVGASPVPHAELLNLVKDDLAAQGIELQVREFTDYVTPNLSLDAGDLDANFFQHVPYLESFSAERRLNLVSAFGVHVEPLGLYSRSLKNAGELQNGASIAIPDDPTNRGRALLLLQTNGLITLSPNAGIEGTPADITSNPRNLRFRELEAAQLPRALGDVDAAIINGNYALDAGLNPVQDSLILEDSRSPYVNVVAVKRGSENDPRILALAAALRSQKVKNFINAAYNGGVVPAF
jgi:D-methionine transport system substrate-binding protein